MRVYGDGLRALRGDGGRHEAVHDPRVPVQLDAVFDYLDRTNSILESNIKTICYTPVFLDGYDSGKRRAYSF